MDQKGNIKHIALKYASKFVEIRRQLHQNPELSFKEFQTCTYLKEQLLNIGIDNIESVAETGLLVTIQGLQTGKTVLLRADMDALPIQEQNEVTYASRNKNIMHACGHDVHMASLLLTAKILYKIRHTFKGTVKLLFQPGEEVVPGGASLVMKEKAYKSLKNVPHIGQHVLPNLPVGKVGFRSGKFMASMDEIFLKVIGKGGHGATPEDTIDPVLIASHIIIAAQQLVSRMSSPKIPTVLSFGKIIGEGAINIIPDEVYIEGTFRTLDESWRKVALKKFTKLVTSIAEGMGAECIVRINHGYPNLINDEELTLDLKKAAISYLGKENVIDMDVWMAAEDFAYYSQQKPSCFYVLGTGNEAKNINSGLHTSTFKIDEKAIEIGGGFMAWSAIETLNK